MGKPIVIPDIPPLNEIMREEVGILLQTNTEEEIIDVLSELLRKDRKCKTYGRAGRALVERYFILDLMSKKYELIYDRLMHGH